MFLIAIKGPGKPLSLGLDRGAAQESGPGPDGESKANCGEPGRLNLVSSYNPQKINKNTKSFHAYTV